MKLLLSIWSILAALQAAEEKTWTLTVEVTNVCGPGCCDILEAAFGKLPGVTSAKVQGYDKQSRFFYDLAVLESRALTPADVKKMLDAIRTASKGDDDFGYQGVEIRSISGGLEKSGEALIFTARGSGMKLEVAPHEGLQSLFSQGKTKVTLQGKLEAVGEKTIFKISNAKESAS